MTTPPICASPSSWNRTLSGLCAVLLLSLFFSAPVQAQTDDDPEGETLISEQGFWLTAGVGLGTGTNLGDGAFAVYGGVNYRFGRHLTTARATTVWEVFGDQVVDVGVAYGRVVPSRLFSLSVYAGPSLVRVLQDTGSLGSDAEDTVYTAGVNFGAGSHFQPGEVLGLGVTLVGNLNPEASFVGLLLTVQLGGIR
jgi:hypothetical protein